MHRAGMSLSILAPRPIGEIRALNGAYVLAGFADATLLPFIPLYLLQRGMSAAAIGVVLAVSALAAVAGGLCWAYLADRRVRPEGLVVLATVAAAAVALFMDPLRGATVGGVVVVALTIARSPLSLLDPITLRKLRVTSRTDYARIRLRMSAGWAVGVIASGALYQAFGLWLVPFVYAPLSLVFGAWVARTIHTDPDPRTDGAA